MFWKADPDGHKIVIASHAAPRISGISAVYSPGAKLRRDDLRDHNSIQSRIGKFFGTFLGSFLGTQGLVGRGDRSSWGVRVSLAHPSRHATTRYSRALESNLDRRGNDIRHRLGGRRQLSYKQH